jgi:pimeloyl-ACP methyl ester carboxylesterase
MTQGAATPMQVRRVRLWQDKVETDVHVRGEGPALVFLHGPWGLTTDGDLLDRLAETYTVYAPTHPGTGGGDPDAIHELADFFDLVLYYGELCERLGLSQSVLVGHSFGGMVACEIAAAMPSLVSKLVLIGPLGLWRDDLPVRNWMIESQQALRASLFADPTGAAAQRFFRTADADASVEERAGFIWAQACTGKFVWPIPDKGLKKHIHRIAAPTLIVWGQQDGLISPRYAQEFAERIAGSRIALVAGAGHLPHLEEPDRVAGLVREFAGSL